MRTPTPSHKARGAALLMILAIILMATISVSISKVSLNRKLIQREQNKTAVLQRAKDSLLGFAMTQAPPGTLPCPDTTGDGFANSTGGGCQNTRGWLPYRSLSLDELRDGGALLWYAVEPAYTANGGGSRNSSRATGLQLDNQPVAAVIIGPGPALPDQQRTTANVNVFLEGVNADADVNTYARRRDELHNDALLAIAVDSYWSHIERVVLPQAAQLLRAYRAACGEYPWAAPFGAAPYNSSAGLKFGSLALAAALPTDWNTGCAAGIAPPAWLVTHWNDQLYYRFCEASEGECLTIVGDNAGMANAVLIAPGIALAGQNRPAAALVDYYESENSVANTAFRHHSMLNHNAGFNDVLLPVAP